MMAWRTVMLGDALEFAYGKNLPKAARATDGRVPVYGSNGITGWHTEVLVQGPTIVVGRKGSAGAVQYVEGPCYPIDTTYYVKPRSGFEFDIHFLYYLLLRLNLPRLRTATGVPGLTREDVYRESISFPPLAEQRRIVDLLSRAEGILRLRREAQAKAQAIIPALFVNMLGDPATNPKGWKAKPLRSVVDIRSGGTPSKSRPDFWVGDLPWVSPKDMKVTALRDAIDKVSRTVLEETSLKLIPSGSVLIVVRGMILVHSVPVALTEVPVTINQDIKALIPHADVSPVYLLWALKVMHDRLLGMVSTAAHGTKKLETEHLEKVALPLPPLELQHAFVQRAMEMSSILELQSVALTAAEHTFASILAKSFES